MMRSTCTLLLLLFFWATSLAQTALQTSFETSDGYTADSLKNQNGWTVTNGIAQVYTSKAKNGLQSMNLGANAAALLTNYVAYAGNVPGITGEVYADMWVNPTSFVTKGISINGMDLFGGSSKRVFVIEFANDGNIKAYNNSTAVTLTPWTANTWVRISLKMDFTTQQYKVAVNGAVYATNFSFREAGYTVTASGTRVAGVREFHALRFNHSSDATIATTNAAFDDIYVGTSAIPDISFGTASTVRTITVTQPDYGQITLSPLPPYTIGQTVTATLTLPQGYANTGWTGALSGTELIKTITVADNITIGATVVIDATNPPPKYLIAVTQPMNGNITLSPASADNMYYKETQVTATVSFEACYQFDGWTGALSGMELSKTFTVQSAATIGAIVSLNTVAATKRTVSTVLDFKNALAIMNPGDTVELNDGTYDLSTLTISRTGCALRPIVIQAKNKGQVILNGGTALLFRNVKYTTLRGFVFKSTGIGTGIKLENCSKFRITENSFAYVETTSCTWINIGDTYASPIPIRSGYNRVDHNIFDGKTQAGNYIRMDGNINQQSQYDTIDHNHFKNNGPRAENEKESIRVGVSTLSKSSGFTLIEYNLFEDCDGDPEIVSIKSCDNTVRYNTFVRCLGTVCLRQGFRSTVEGNYFFGDNKTGTYNGGTLGCGGVRVYAKDHKIINNYFSGLTGSRFDAAITITNGDVDNNSTSVADHYLPENVIVAYNTLVNNKSDIELGFTNNGSYPLSPINCLLTNNIVVENLNPIVKVHQPAALQGVAFANNIMYATGTSSIGFTATPAEVIEADPALTAPICISPANCETLNASKVMRISANSPAIDAGIGTYNFVSLDNEQQTRTGFKDIGADEYTSLSPINVSFTALSAANVGPDAIGAEYSYLLTGVLPLKIISFTASKISTASKLLWIVSGEENEIRYEVEWSDNGNTFTKIATVPAVGSSATQYYTYLDGQHITGKNYYRLKIVDRDGRYSYSTVCYISYSISAHVYPNPSTEKILIETNVPGGTMLKIVLSTMDGRKIKAITTKQQGILSMQLQGIAAGVYLLQISTDTEIIGNQKVVIEK